MFVDVSAKKAKTNLDDLLESIVNKHQLNEAGNGDRLGDLSSFPSIPDRLQQGLIDFLYLGRDLINPAGFCSSGVFRVTASA